MELTEEAIQPPSPLRMSHPGLIAYEPPCTNLLLAKNPIVVWYDDCIIVPNRPIDRDYSFWADYIGNKIFLDGTDEINIARFGICEMTLILETSKLGFSVTSSSDGGIDIKIGMDTINVNKYISAHHPVAQMLLFARQLSLNKFEIAKSMVPQIIVDMFEKPSYSTSPKMYEAGWSPAKSSNAATPEYTEVGSDDGSSRASLPVLELYYDGNFSGPILSLVDMGSIVSEDGWDLIMLAPEETLHERNIMDNTGGSYTRMLKTLTSIVCSAHKDVKPKIRDTEPGNHRTDNVHAVAFMASAPDSGKSMATWLVASAAPQHATGNHGLLSDFKPEHGLFVEAGDGEPMQVCGRGSVITDAVVLSNVLFVPGLTNNLVSASQLTQLEYCLGFARGSCFIRRMTDNMLVGKASLGVDGLFQLDYLKLPVII